MDEWRLRHQIYRTFAETGGAPSSATVAEWVGDAGRAGMLLRRLHDAHQLVLGDGGAVRMALPFSAVPTSYRVSAASGSWWANCAWDSLAIPAALDLDATIDAKWMDTGEPVDLLVRGGELVHWHGYVHFVVPARHWWDDIVET